MANPTVAAGVPKQANLVAALWVSDQIESSGTKKGAWDAVAATYHAPFGPSTDPQDDFTLAPALGGRNGLRSTAVNCGIHLAALNSTGTVYDFSARPFDIIVVATSLGAGLRYLFSNSDHFSPNRGWSVTFPDAAYVNLNITDTDTTNFPPNGYIQYGYSTLTTNVPVVLRLSVDATGGYSFYKDGTLIGSYSSLAFVGPINYASTANRRPALFRTAQSGGGSTTPADIYAAFLYTGANLTVGEGQFFSSSSGETAAGKFYDAFNFGDSTAPVLSAPTGTAPTATTATVGATTNEANGTLYAVVTTSATQPSIAQIKAGQNNGGTAAAYASNQVITTTGAKTFSATGLTASTGYYAHIVHTDAAANDSNRVSSALFTTPASDTTAPTLSAPTRTVTGKTTATLGATTNEGNGSMYFVVTTSATAPSATQVKAGQNNAGTAAVFAVTQAISSTGAKTASATGLTAGTVYYAYVVHTDAAANNSTVLSIPTFTTLIYGFDFDTAVGWKIGLRAGGGPVTIGRSDGASLHVSAFTPALVLGAPVATAGPLTTTAGRLARWTHAALDGPGVAYEIRLVDAAAPTKPASRQMVTT